MGFDSCNPQESNAKGLPLVNNSPYAFRLDYLLVHMAYGRDFNRRSGFPANGACHRGHARFA